MQTRARENLARHIARHGTYKVDIAKVDFQNVSRWCSLCEGRYITHTASPILPPAGETGNVEICRGCVEELGVESVALKGIYLFR